MRLDRRLFFAVTHLARLTPLLLVFGLPQVQAADKKPNEVVFGVLPIVSTERLVARFGPLADYLSRETGAKIRMETAADFKTFLRRTNNKRYDLVFTAPHFYYVAQRQAGYRVIVQVAAPDLRAIIVTKKGGTIHQLSDLKGKKLSTADPLALATMMVRNHLLKAGVDPDADLTLVPTPNHSASLYSAQIGVTDAAGLMLPPFKRAKPGIQQAMQILATTEGSPHMPIAVAASMDPKLANKIESALVQLKDKKEADTILKPLRWPGFVSVKPELYDRLDWAVEQLR